MNVEYKKLVCESFTDELHVLNLCLYLNGYLLATKRAGEGSLA